MKNSQVMLLSERKNKMARKTAVSNFIRPVVTTGVIMVAAFTANCFAAAAATAPDAASAITTAKSLLSKAATAGGGLWAVWGLVTLGMSIKDSNGPGIGNAIWQILGGAIIIAAGVAIGALDLSMTV